jgi:2-phospho-L-lactate/phosphoenolpyruvate guanylyltransferase
MNTWAVIPVKPLKRAKSRLADVLSKEQRAEFAEMMYRQVLQVVMSADCLNGVIVISRDTEALAIARDFGAKTIQESSKSDLNPALRRATEMVKLWRADAILILPADLPFVSLTDVDQLVTLGRSMREPSIVIATDDAQDGTNAMLVRPPSLFDYNYGDGSFTKHVTSAREIGASVQIYESETIKLDIDVPADLDRYNEMVQSGLYTSNLTPFLPI